MDHGKVVVVYLHYYCPHWWWKYLTRADAISVDYAQIGMCFCARQGTRFTICIDKFSAGRAITRIFNSSGTAFHSTSEKFIQVIPASSCIRAALQVT